ncbi:MAG: Zn-dependent hydrolase [Deltaproteobacteria bacterium RBG_13_52_11]|nr:MAG: Zn-dependent hydrolase [Deltaproteobacteria bacterium RBG_13_52_11]
MGPREVTKEIYLVVGADITDPRDCAIYLLDLGDLVMIDAGAGESYDEIVLNIERLGLDPTKLTTIILTHCHIDHIGGAPRFREAFGAQIIMHHLDAESVERGDDGMTAASWYNLRFPPMSVDVKLKKEEERLLFGDQEVICLHTPGHTPGSLSVYLDRGGNRILFGQDIHGPFSEDFGSDLAAWRQSMQRLLALEADILCEGHFGVYQPKEGVAAYIEHYLEQYGEGND